MLSIVHTNQEDNRKNSCRAGVKFYGPWMWGAHTDINLLIYPQNSFQRKPKTTTPYPKAGVFKKSIGYVFRKYAKIHVEAYRGHIRIRYSVQSKIVCASCFTGLFKGAYIKGRNLSIFREKCVHFYLIPFRWDTSSFLYWKNS